jgi:diguanylate cyclase (GGDEF)-like protein
MRPSVLVIACAGQGGATVEASLAEDDVAIVRANGTGEGLDVAARGAMALVLVVAPGDDAETHGLVRRLRTDRHTSEVPVIVLAENASTRSVVQALELGATDYLPATIPAPELRARVRMALQEKRRFDGVVVGAGIDALTRLGNAGHLDRRLDEELDVWDRYHRDVALVLVEIDGFATAEDEHGLALGETILLRVCEALQKCARSTDVLFHRGGGRFAAVLRETPGIGAMVFAERVRGRIEALASSARPRIATATASVGVGSTALWRMAGTDMRGRLFGEANAALLRARLAGGNRCELGLGVDVPVRVAG